MKQSGWGIASLVCGIAGILLACVAIGVSSCNNRSCMRNYCTYAKMERAWNCNCGSGLFNSCDNYFYFCGTRI